MNGYAPSARKRLIQYSKPPPNVNFVPKTLYSPKITNRIPTAMRSPARALVLESSVGTAFESGPSIIADQTYTKLAFEGDCSSSCRLLGVHPRENSVPVGTFKPQKSVLRMCKMKTVRQIRHVRGKRRRTSSFFLASRTPLRGYFASKTECTRRPPGVLSSRPKAGFGESLESMIRVASV